VRFGASVETRCTLNRHPGTECADAPTPELAISPFIDAFVEPGFASTAARIVQPPVAGEIAQAGPPASPLVRAARGRPRGAEGREGVVHVDEDVPASLSSTQNPARSLLRERSTSVVDSQLSEPW